MKLKFTCLSTNVESGSDNVDRHRADFTIDRKDPENRKEFVSDPNGDFSISTLNADPGFVAGLSYIIEVTEAPAAEAAPAA